MQQTSHKPISPSVNLVCLKTERESPVFKHFYADWRMLGKHFRVQDAKNLALSRHYTIANVMIPHIYDEYLKALKASSPLAPSVFDVSDQNCRYLVVKNYKKGLSKQLCGDLSQQFILSGPYGLGLLEKTDGLHIAFAAGTGVLVFMDLVA
jgi:hypothetical protein